MKLSKGKINKIKGKRIQSKKRIGHKHKHLVKHGRGFSYRKKRHFNLKNQTLKRFGIEVGGGDENGSPVNNESKNAKDANNLEVNKSNNNLSSNASNASNAINVDTKEKENDKASKKISSFLKKISFNKEKSNSTNANESNLSGATTDADASKSATTTPNTNNIVANPASASAPASASPSDKKNKLSQDDEIISKNYIPFSETSSGTSTNGNAVKYEKKTNVDSKITNSEDVTNGIVVKAPLVANKIVTTNPQVTIPSNQKITTQVTTPITSQITTTATTPPRPPTTTINAPASAPSEKTNELSQATYPQFVDLPDHFGPSTTMAEVANYFSNVFLVQLLSKFDIKTSMTLRDILLTMNKVNNNMGYNSNGIGSSRNGSSGNGIGNGSGNGIGNGIGNGSGNMQQITSDNLMDNLKITQGTSIATYNDPLQYSTSNNGANGVDPNNNGANNANGFNPMQLPFNGYNPSPENPTGDVNPKDTRSRLEIQNDNADLDLKNTKLDTENNSLNAEKASLTEEVTKNTKAIEDLKKNPNPNDEEKEKIKQLEKENATHQLAIKEKEVQITKNQSEKEDIQRKLKANKYAEWKTKSNWEVASDVGNSAYGVAKSGANVLGSAASSAYTGTKDFAKQTIYGKDIDVLNKDHQVLKDKETAIDNKLRDLNAELNKKDPNKTLADTERIKKEIKQATTEKTNINNAIKENRKNHTIKMGQINEIIESHNNPEAPVSREGNRISDEREDEHPTSRVLEGRKANEIEENGHLQETKSVKEGSRINSEIEEGDKRSIGKVFSDKLSDLNNKTKNAFSSMLGSKSESNIEHSESNIEHMQMLNDARKAKQMVENERKNQPQHSEHKQSGQQHHENPQHKNQHRHSRGGGKKTNTKKTRKLQKR